MNYLYIAKHFIVVHSTLNRKKATKVSWVFARAPGFAGSARLMKSNKHLTQEERDSDGRIGAEECSTASALKNMRRLRRSSFIMETGKSIWLKAQAVRVFC